MSTDAQYNQDIFDMQTILFKGDTLSDLGINISKHRIGGTDGQPDGILGDNTSGVILHILLEAQVKAGVPEDQVQLSWNDTTAGIVSAHLQNNGMDADDADKFVNFGQSFQNSFQSVMQDVSIHEGVPVDIQPTDSSFAGLEQEDVMQTAQDYAGSPIEVTTQNWHNRTPEMVTAYMAENNVAPEASSSIPYSKNVSDMQAILFQGDTLEKLGIDRTKNQIGGTDGQPDGLLGANSSFALQTIVYQAQRNSGVADDQASLNWDKNTANMVSAYLQDNGISADDANKFAALGQAIQGDATLAALYTTKSSVDIASLTPAETSVAAEMDATTPENTDAVSADVSTLSLTEQNQAYSSFAFDLSTTREDTTPKIGFGLGQPSTQLGFGLGQSTTRLGFGSSPTNITEPFKQAKEETEVSREVQNREAKVTGPTKAMTYTDYQELKSEKLLGVQQKALIAKFEPLYEQEKIKQGLPEAEARLKIATRNIQTEWNDLKNQREELGKQLTQEREKFEANEIVNFTYDGIEYAEKISDIRELDDGPMWGDWDTPEEQAKYDAAYAAAIEQRVNHVVDASTGKTYGDMHKEYIKLTQEVWGETPFHAIPDGRRGTLQQNAKEEEIAARENLQKVTEQLEATAIHVPTGEPTISPEGNKMLALK